MIKAFRYTAKHAFSRPKTVKIERAEPGATGVQIDVLYCGVCHSEIHQAENDWDNAVYPPHARARDPRGGRCHGCRRLTCHVSNDI